MKIITVYVSDDDVKFLDLLVEKGMTASRSDSIRIAIANFVTSWSQRLVNQANALESLQRFSPLPIPQVKRGRPQRVRIKRPDIQDRYYLEPINIEEEGRIP